MNVESKLINDFSPFFNDMIEELVKHYPEKGDTWKTCEMSMLVSLFYDSMSEIIKDGIVNIDHILDIANVGAMIYLREKGMVFHSHNDRS